MVGVGVTAYPRSGLSGRVPGFRIACVRRTADLPALRRGAEIFCLEEALGRALPEAVDSTALLSHPLARTYLAELPPPVHLLLYQSTPEIERIAADQGWRLLANPAALRTRTADRAFFQGLVASLGLPRGPGRMVSLRRFLERTYEDWVREMGPRLVIQLPDVFQGGGRSTFFSNRSRDHERIRAHLAAGRWRGNELRRVSVRAFVGGEPCSVTACIQGGTPWISPLQRQIIDPPWVEGVPSDGVFAGHSWGGEGWGADLEEEARGQGLAVARVLTSMGYRGVFGLDLLADRARGQVVPVELNPRLTGAFPVLTQLQAARGEIPLELRHLQAFLAGGDPEGGRRRAGQAEGAHLVLFRGLGRSLKRPPPRAGLYAWDRASGSTQWVREATDLREIGGTHGFLLIDGPPLEEAEGGMSADPLERIGRLVFAGPVLTPEGRFQPGVPELASRVLDDLLLR